jgi:hypothetical protein
LAKRQVPVLEYPLSHLIYPCVFFHIPKTKEFCERFLFWITWRHSKQCDDSTDRFSGKLIYSDVSRHEQITECSQKLAIGLYSELIQSNLHLGIIFCLRCVNIILYVYTSFPGVFQPEISILIRVSFMYAICPIHLILFYLFILEILGY